MPQPSRLRPWFALLLVFVTLSFGCSRTSPTAPESLLAGDADGTYGGAPFMGLLRPEGNESFAEHDYFPFSPGRASDFDVMLAGYEPAERAMRVVVGLREEFFGRKAVPWVYEEIPGEVPDSTLLDLRQYWSVSPEGDLLFHGAQNKGVMSFYDPPVRVLPARPRGGETWRDTVVFQSFLPGTGLFDSATVVLETKISERTFLRLPGGNMHAFRATQTVLDVIRGRMPASRDDEVGARKPQELEILKGFWFARNRGIVARDYPFGPGPTNTNVRTYSLRDEGSAPIPPAEPVPPL